MKKLPRHIHHRMLFARKRLLDRYPACFMPFGALKKPLKIGIRDDLFGRARSAYDWQETLFALADYTDGDHYHEAMVAGAVRVDLDGQPAGVVTERDAALAAGILAKRQRRAENIKREAEKAAKREAEKKAAAEKAKRKADAEARALMKHSHPAPRQRPVQVEVIRTRRPGAAGVTRRFG